MADKAAMGYYHDYLSPLDLPETQLVNDLFEASRANPLKDQILQLRNDVIDGKYDATKAESDEWARSPEGKETFRKLIKGE
jgi:hypothetical protein